jgi:Spy/CpxP family protein refolding chaperone
MNIRRNSMKIATVSFALLLAAGTAFAQRGMWGGGPGMGAAATDQLKAYLNLSDAQLQQITGIQSSFRDAARPLMQQMREKAQTLRQTLKADPNADVTQLEADLAGLRTQVSDLRAQYRTQADNVLTEDQKANLANLQKALELMPAAHQAIGLNLLEGPEGFAGGFGGHRFFRGRGPAAPPAN